MDQNNQTETIETIQDVNPQPTEENPIVTTEPTEEVKVAEPVEEAETSINVDEVQIEVRENKAKQEIDLGEDIDVDEARSIANIVDKKTEYMRQELQATKDQYEVDSYIQKNPEFGKYKPVILKYLQHPVYSNIPVHNIAAMVASKDLIKLGAKREREAQAKAASSANPVSQVRSPESTGTVDWLKMSKEDFEKQKQRVLGRG